MHKSVIVMKAKGHTIPLDFATKVLEAYPSCSGVGMIHKGKLVVQVSKEPLTPEKLVKTSEKFKDLGMVFSFGRYDEGFLDRDIQPYIALDDANGQHIIIAFLSGQFPGYVLAGSNESPEHRYSEIYLTPKIAQLYDLSDKEDPKLMAFLQKETIKNEMTMPATGDSQVVLMSRTGQVLVYPKDHNCRPTEAEWGWYTDPKLTEDTPAEAEPEIIPAAPEPDPNAEPDIFGDDGPLPNPTPANVTVKSGKPVIAATTPIKPPVTATAIPKPKAGERLLVSHDSQGDVHMDANQDFFYTPNKNLHGKALKAGYRNKLGGDKYLPNGTKGTDEHFGNYPTIKVTHGPTIQNYKSKVVTANVGGQNIAAVAPAPKAADPTTAKTAEVVHLTPFERPTLVPAAIEGVTKKLAVPEMKQAIDDHSNDIVDPTVLSHYEKKFPSACQAIGYKGGIEATLRWPFTVYRELCQNHPDWAAMLLMDYRFEWLSKLSEDQLKALLTPKKEAPARVHPAVARRQAQQGK